MFLRRVLAADPLPGVSTDDDAVLRLAVEHLVDRGFCELAFCPAATDWSAARREAFVRHAERAGFGVLVFEAGAAAASVSRRLLDKKFQKHLGRTIHEKIMRTRLAEARRLLVETDHKLLVVAVRSGFAHAAQLCNLLKAAHGMSPMQYRTAARPWEG